MFPTRKGERREIRAREKAESSMEVKEKEKRSERHICRPMQRVGLCPLEDSKGLTE